MTEPKEIPETNAPTELTDEELKAIAGGLKLPMPSKAQYTAAMRGLSPGQLEGPNNTTPAGQASLYSRT